MLVSEEQLHNMEHALGIADYMLSKISKYHRYGKCYIKSYRNYFCAGQRDLDSWRDLVDKGLATTWNNFNSTYFNVSDKGIEYLQEVQNYIIKFRD